MRLAFAPLVIVAVACSKPTPSERAVAEAGVGESSDFIPGHVLVKTKAGGPLLETQAKRLSLVKDHELGGGAILYRIEGLDPKAPDAKKRTLDAIDALRKDPAVAWAEVDAIVTTQ